MCADSYLLGSSNYKVKNISSISPDWKDVLSIKENQGRAVYNRTYYGIFSRPKEAFPNAITGDLKIKWLTNDAGAVTNKGINSVGMWTSFRISTLGYLIPLAFFLLGVKYFKTIMTIFCSMGLLSGLTMIGTIIVLCSFVSNISYDSTIIGSLISSGLLCVVNLVWFIVVFFPGSKNAIKGS